MMHFVGQLVRRFPALGGGHLMFYLVATTAIDFRDCVSELQMDRKAI